MITWEQRYTTEEWVTLLGTHSDHRILPEEQRTRLHAAVGAVIDRHGGFVALRQIGLQQFQALGGQFDVVRFGVGLGRTPRQAETSGHCGKSPSAWVRERS